MAIVLSQIQVILVRIAKGHVLSFKANSGWLGKFKARHGVHKLMLFQKLKMMLPLKGLLVKYERFRTVIYDATYNININVDHC